MSAVPPQTRDAQRKATDPHASAFVAANAGSGKTYVLTRRVIRLMLAGCEPGRILCLTFTKAAAAEMANRILDLLGQWAVAADASLAAELAELEGAPPPPRRLAAARRLFARALETPGGLKVQTIHAFAEALLQRFPIEANLPGRFDVLDDRTALLLRAEAKADLVRETLRDPDGPLAAALAELLATTSDDAVDAVLAGLVAEREAFHAWIRAHDSLDAAIAALPAALGLPPGASEAGLMAQACANPDFSGPALSRLIDVLDRAGNTNSKKLSAIIRTALAAEGEARFDRWCDVFLTREGKPRSATTTIVTAVEAALPGLRERFAAEAERIAGLRVALSGLATARRTAAVARLADRLIGLFQARKAAIGALDYDDLIQRAADLLARSDAALWVQYKLDEGLDHVLVDEAQDTSPRQWRIVDALTDDFFSGRSARDTRRTVFAVGDEKQSIYSFQGAAPHLFAEARSRFVERIRAAGAAVHELELQLSFRSTPDVVKAVDAVFAAPAASEGLSADGRPPVHETIRSRDPGLVEVWPELEAIKAEVPDRWEDPVDAAGAGSPQKRLADRIAATIRGWLDGAERLPATGRPIRAGDVLILVRKRAAFVEAMNRALTERRIPIAGADRLDVVGHIVAADMIGAARVGLLPEDDLTLAAVLRSPLVGLSEEDLFVLAHGRPGSLHDALAEAARAGHGPASRALATIARWIERAGWCGPHAFMAALAAEDGARAAFRARFGREADEVIDELLNLAAVFEEREAASLQSFVVRVADLREERKREVEGGRDEVRVMTVHGAKGLEAPVVFLVDPGDAPTGTRHDPKVVALGPPGAPLVWTAGKIRPKPVEDALVGYREVQAREYRRLLYVGLTRARDRLIVTGIKRDRVAADGRWHTLVAEALQAGSEEVVGPDGALLGWRWRLDGDRPPHPPVDVAAAHAPVPVRPGWLDRPPPPSRSPRVLTPSAATAFAAGADPAAVARAAADGETPAQAAALARGTLVHRLLELLPDVAPSERRARAERFLERRGDPRDVAGRAGLLDAVLAILDHPDFADLFGPKGRAEVSLSGEIAAPDGARLRVQGRIDRLAVGPDAVLVVDYKTNREVPDAIPPDYLAQLALYRRLLQDALPGRTVRCAILWTEAPRLDWAGTEAMDRAITALFTKPGSPAGGARS